MLGFVALHGLSLAAASGGNSPAAVPVFLVVLAPGVAEHRLRARRPQQSQHMGSAAVACGLQSMGSQIVVHSLATPRHAESSQTRD